MMNATMLRKSRLFVTTILFLVTGVKGMTTSVEGYWQTIDDKTDEVKSIVRTWIEKDGTLKGRIVKIFPKEGEDPDPVCDKCKGTLKDRRIIGICFSPTIRCLQVPAALQTKRPLQWAIQRNWRCREPGAMMGCTFPSPERRWSRAALRLFGPVPTGKVRGARAIPGYG